MPPAPAWDQRCQIFIVISHKATSPELGYPELGGFLAKTIFNFSQYDDFIVQQQNKTSIDVPVFGFIGFFVNAFGLFSGYSSLMVLSLNLEPFFLLCQKLKWQNTFASLKSLPFTFEGENSIETNLQTCNLWTSQSPCYNYNVG